MKIEFNTQEAGTDEAKGLVAMLVSLYGSTVLPVPQLEVRVGDISVRGDEAAVLRQMATETGDEPKNWENAAEQEMLRTMRPEEEPDAAAAFGGNAPSVAAVPGPTGERDSAGIPWDERIHASTKTRTANQQWTRRRNTPDATYDAVMAELRGAPAIPPATAAVIVPPPPTTAPAPSPAPAVAAASSSAPGAIDPASPTAFPDIMKKVTAAQAIGKVTTDWVGDTVTSLGGTPRSITALMSNKNLIPAFEALLDAHVAAQG